MPKIYLETSFISYLVARPSRDLIMAARQQVTADWWNNERHQHEVFASDVVRDEAQRGDATQIAKRMAVLNQLPILPLSDKAEALANLLLARHALPQKAYLDALHIAVASVEGMDYLLTWNCKHIANLAKRGAIEQTCREAGYYPLLIGTPEELI